MSKLPLETRPLRLAPALVQAVEDMLRPFTGKKLEAAQAAVLKVYQSGAQMEHSLWITAYRDAIAAATAMKESREASVAQ